MNTEQIEKLKAIRAKGTIDPVDESFLWELHLEKTSMYPTGNRGCSSCKREVFEKMWSIMQAQLNAPDNTTTPQV